MGAIWKEKTSPWIDDASRYDVEAANVRSTIEGVMQILAN
jgi:hypothetical protein